MNENYSNKNILFTPRLLIAILFILYGQNIFSISNSDSLVNLVSRIYLNSMNTHVSKSIENKFYLEQRDKLTKNNTMAESSEFAISLGQNLKEKGNYKDAISIFSATVIFLQTENPVSIETKKKLFTLNNSIGVIYKDLGDNKQAMEKYLLASRLAKSMNWNTGLAKSYNNLSELYYEQSNFEKAEQMLKEAAAINLKTNQNNDLEINFNNLGVIYYKQKRYKESLDYYNKALALLVPKDFFARAALYTNISQVYKSKKQYQVASEYLTKALELQKKTHNDHYILTAIRDLAEIQALSGKKADALRLSDKALTLCRKLNIPSETAETYRILTDASLALGDTAQAMQYMLSHETISDSIRQATDKESLHKLLSVYEVEMLKYKNQELEQSYKIKELTIGRQRLILAGVGVIFLLSLLLFYFLFKKNKAEQEKKRLIAEHKEQLLYNERQLFEKNRKEMEIEIDFKNRQLTSYTLNQVSTSEFNQRIVEKLELLKKTNPNQSVNDIKQGLGDVIREICHYSDNSVSEEFKAYFNSVHPSFFDNISKANPSLTGNELRLCAFLRLGLSTKEIASLTFREIRSVESARNRLRKKIELDVDMNLNSYLARF